MEGLHKSEKFIQQAGLLCKSMALYIYSSAAEGSHHISVFPMRGIFSFDWKLNLNLEEIQFSEL